MTKDLKFAHRELETKQDRINQLEGEISYIEIYSTYHVGTKRDHLMFIKGFETAARTINRESDAILAPVLKRIT